MKPLNRTDACIHWFNMLNDNSHRRIPFQQENASGNVSWIIYYISDPISWIFEAILAEADVPVCLPAALGARKGEP